MKYRRAKTCADYPPAVSPAHYSWHHYNRTEPCARSRAEQAEYEWMLTHPEAEKYAPRRDNLPIRLYRLYFISEDAYYYGITNKAGNRRIVARYNNEEVQALIESGAMFTRKILAVFPTRREAEEAERGMIELADRFGVRLLNKAKRLPPEWRGGGLRRLPRLFDLEAVGR